MSNNVWILAGSGTRDRSSIGMGWRRPGYLGPFDAPHSNVLNPVRVVRCLHNSEGLHTKGVLQTLEGPRFAEESMR
jgi:hypothetical protein